MRCLNNIITTGLRTFPLAILMAFGIVIGTPKFAFAQNAEPIIDMHMHARTSAVRTDDGNPADPPCFPESCVSFPTKVRTDADVLGLAIDAMKRNNIILGVVTDWDLDQVYEWVAADPERFFAGSAFFDPERVDISDIRSEFEAGRLQVMGEIGSQYAGYPPDDPAVDPFFSLAEEFDVPTLIHTEGIAGPSSRFRIAHGHPEQLQQVLEDHPDLRLYLENAGYPFLDEMIALMYRYPQVYADVSTITWIIPRGEFYRYLEALMDAGLGKRLMWGSDQMNWPGTIDKGLEAIREAPFLTQPQKRDILYNNAARFLRLTEEEVASTTASR